MIKKTFHFIAGEWKLCFWFIVLILLIAGLGHFYVKHSLLRVILFCLGLDLYSKFLFTAGRIMKNGTIENPYSYIIFTKERNGYNFIILLALFAAVLAIFQGPVMLFTVVFSGKIKEFLAALGQWVIVINILVIIFMNTYKIALFAAISNITYHGSEVLDAFLAGLKGIWHFKIIFILLTAFQIAFRFSTPVLTEMTKSYFDYAKFSGLVAYLLPAFIMLFMVSYYDMNDQKGISS